MYENEYHECEYKLIEEIEDTVELLQHKFNILQKLIDDLECEQEVEDFLLNGPGGKDPY